MSLAARQLVALQCRPLPTPVAYHVVLLCKTLIGLTLHWFRERIMAEMGHH